MQTILSSPVTTWLLITLTVNGKVFSSLFFLTMQTRRESGWLFSRRLYFEKADLDIVRVALQEAVVDGSRA